VYVSLNASTYVVRLLGTVISSKLGDQFLRTISTCTDSDYVKFVRYNTKNRTVATFVIFNIESFTHFSR